MVDREACELRVYRLATLLTGHPLAASRVIEQVVDAQPDLSRLDSAHLDRLTVLRSRELDAAMLVSDDVPRGVAAALAALPVQPREAWVLARVYRLGQRELARAMDCSTTAARRHLAQADDAMAATGDARAAAATLLAFSQRLVLPAFFRAERARRRRIRRVLLPAAVVVAAVAIILAVLWWRGRDVVG